MSTSTPGGATDRLWDPSRVRNPSGSVDRTGDDGEDPDTRTTTDRSRHPKVGSQDPVEDRGDLCMLVGENFHECHVFTLQVEGTHSVPRG